MTLSTPTRHVAGRPSALATLTCWLACLAVLAPVVASAAGAQLAPRVLAAMFAAILLALSCVGLAIILAAGTFGPHRVAARNMEGSTANECPSA